MDNDTVELEKGLKIGKTVSNTNTRAIWSLIVKYWDCFCAEGAKRTILDYEFAIDTGVSSHISCCKLAYDPHEARIIMEQIFSLLENDWISDCGGSWGSQIVLVAKPYQEHIDNINKYTW